jgi:hypothetical protein
MNRLARAAAALILAVSPALAQDNADLAKQLANPVSSLISVPFQLNYDDGFGPQDGHRTYMNIQPVVPFSLNERWNMIVRTIVPVIDQHDVVPGTGSQFGLGDTTQSLFLSPKRPGPGGLIWGVGPAFLWPTATETSSAPASGAPGRRWLRSASRAPGPTASSPTTSGATPATRTGRASATPSSSRS